MAVDLHRRLIELGRMLKEFCLTVWCSDPPDGTYHYRRDIAHCHERSMLDPMWVGGPDLQYVNQILIKLLAEMRRMGWQAPLTELDDNSDPRHRLYEALYKLWRESLRCQQFGIPQMVLPKRAQEYAALIAEAIVSQPVESVKGDIPDCIGYVDSPVDAAAYVEAKFVLSDYTPEHLSISNKMLTGILEDFEANRVRWTRPRDKRGKPIPNRRRVHLGDWHVLIKGFSKPDPDGFPRVPDCDVERRKAALRQANQARN